MKIVHISIYPPRNQHHAEAGGVASYTKNLVTSMAQGSSDEVWVLANREQQRDERYDENGVHVIRCFDRKPGFVRQLMREIKRIGPDAVHVQQELALFGGILTAVLLRFLLRRIRSRARLIVTLHGVVSLKDISRSFVRANNSRLPVSIVRLAFAIIFKPLTRLAHKLIVHEKLFADILEKEYATPATKIAVIPHGVEDLVPMDKTLARQKLGLPADGQIVLYMGYLTGYKGLDLLIDSAALWLQDNPKAYLAIGAGKHPKLHADPTYLTEYQRIQSKAAALPKFGRQACWEGFIPEKKIALWYSAADVSIYPYTVSMSSSGPMALSLGYHCPFVASDVFAKVFDDDCLLFARRPEALAKHLDEFFENPAQWQEITERLREKRLWTTVSASTRVLYH